MQRREFVTLLGSAAVWPLTVRAQQSDRVRRIGILLAAAPNDLKFQAWVGAFLQGLGQLGWTIGRNLRIGLSANDPKRTSAVHCGNCFDAIFSPYQSTWLSR